MDCSECATSLASISPRKLVYSRIRRLGNCRVDDAKGQEYRFDPAIPKWCAMHVVGELTYLPKPGTRNPTPPLPIPWFIRAPLGMLTDTNVFVSIVRPPKKKQEAVGELLVSVINPTRDLIHIQCKKHDEPAVLSKVFETLHELPGKDNINIALAEGVTVDHRDYYQAALVCELLDSHETDDEEHPNEKIVGKRNRDVRKRAISIQKILKRAGFEGWYSDIPEVAPQPAFRFLRWYRTGQVVNGLIKDVQWHEKVKELASAEFPNSAQYDFARAVVSCNTRQRLARFVFPKQGAVSIVIKHADTPGALAVLTQCLASKGLELNILSTILRRGGAKDGGSAVLVAVCEPTLKDEETEKLLADMKNRNVEIPKAFEVELNDKFRSLENKIAMELNKVPAKFCAEWTVNQGKEWQKTLYLKHPDDIGVRVPEELRLAVEQVKNEEVLPKRIPVFLSRRFAGNTPHTNRILEKIREALQGRKCQAIEATPVSGTARPTIHQVESRLWACKMGIVLVTDLDTIDALSMNLAHEYGFISGQGKPVIFLVEQKIRESVTKRISNLQGMVVSEFADGETALDDSSPNSIFARVKEWLDRVNPQSDRA